MADGYQPQLNPGGQSDFSGAPSDWGGGIARGLEYAGDAMDSAIHQIKDKNRDAEATAAGVQLAQNSAALDQQAIALRQQAGPGGAGHTQNVNAAIDDATQGALGNIKDPHIRRAFTERYADLKGQLSTREYGWASGQYVNYLATNVKNATDIYAKDQAANPTLASLPNQLTAIHDTIHSTSLDADLQEKLTKEQQRQVVLSYANAAVRTDPRSLIGDPDTGSKGILQDPRFYNYLQPEDIDTLRHSGEVEIRRQDAEGRQRANLQKSQDVQALSLAKDQISHGYQPTQDDWANWQGLAHKWNLGKDVFDFEDLKDSADIGQQYRTATPITLQHDINELATKQANKQTTPAEDIHLKNLREFAGPAIEQFNKDPYSWAANAGNPAPAIDFTADDPNALRQAAAQRVAWARGLAASAGMVNVPYLNPTEKQQFTQRMAQGPAGQLETTTDLRNTFGGTVASDIVKQLAPGNKDVELMVGLNPRVAQLYERGVQAVQGKTVHLGATGQNAQTDVQNMTDAFNFYKGAIPVDMQPAFRRAAENVTAGVAAEFGRSEPTGDELKNSFSQVMQRVGGMNGSPSQGSALGGFANKGKPFGRSDGDDNLVWLPPTMSRADFNRRISTAGKADWTKAAGSAPHYLGPNGKLAPLNDVQLGQLRNYKFETVSPGTYRLIGPDGGHVVDGHGRPWQFNVGNLR